ARADAVSAALCVVGLRTECLDRPLGLETQRPRLSWRLESERPDARQSAWRVRVAASEAALARGDADLWDSGRVEGDRTFDVAYAGAPLASRQRCWWTVEAWGEAGRPAAAAPAAWWEMGLLDPADWTAGWLCVETAEDRADRDAGLHWVWGEAGEGAHSRRFRRRFELAEPATAELIVGARHRLTGLWIDGAPLAHETPHAVGFGQGSAAQRLGLGTLAAGRHVLAAEAIMDVRRYEGAASRGAFAALLKLRFADGRIERLTTESGWQVASDPATGWPEIGFDDSDWDAAAPADRNPGQAWPPTSAMLMRKRFEPKQPVVAARLYATALGAYEAFLNGARVGDARLAPESTDFRKRALYQVYDVTELVRDGENVLAAHVGDGWYGSVIAPL